MRNKSKDEIWRSIDGGISVRRDPRVSVRGRVKQEESFEVKMKRRRKSMTEMKDKDAADVWKEKV